MALTQQDLDALDETIASGTLMYLLLAASGQLAMFS